MCESFVAEDIVSDRLKITNTKIISFYQSNPHINFEELNLLIIDVLKKSGSLKTIETMVDNHKIKELDAFVSNMREVVRKLIHSVSRKYIAAKTEYIREFKSAALESESRELISAATQKLFEKSCSLLSVVFQLRISSVAEKTKIILHQFNKILTANTEQIFAKMGCPIKTDEYIQNFDSNSTHMMQAIMQLLSDLLSNYETRVKQVADSIKSSEDPSFTIYYKLIYELNDIIHQLPSQDDDEAISFEKLLSQTFPTASITAEQESNEFHLIRDNKSAIYFETYENRDHNVGVSEVKQFIKRTTENNSNGILVSQYTGITSKPNYHIEIHSNIVVVYLHKVQFSSETLQKATDMIDAISGKLTEFSSLSENKYSIPKEILDGVNREYQQFILQKEAIITGFKEHQKRLLSQLDDMRFSTLDKYLSTRYSSCKKQGYNCDLCNSFNVATLKGLAAHKRGCIRKMALSDNLINPLKPL